MPALKAKKVKSALLKKGFVIDNSRDHHNFFEFFIGDTMYSRTHTSHNDQDINDYLIGQMSRQCQLNKKQFMDLVNCPLSKTEYEKILKGDS